MKQLLSLMVVALLASVLTVWWLGGRADASSAVRQESAYERVMRTGVLRCGYAMWPPFVVKDPNTGQITGTMHELIENMAKRLDLKVEWTEETGWGNWIEGLNSKRFDVFCPGVWVNAERGRYVTYLRPIFYSTTYVYVRSDETRFDETRLEELNSPEVIHSVQDGEMSDLIAKNDFPKAKAFSIPQLSSLSDMLINVVDGKADVVITDPTFVNQYLANNPGKLKKLSQVPFRIFTATFAVGLGETTLANMLNAALVEMENQGVIERVLRQTEPDKSVVLSVAKPYEIPAELP